VSDGSVIEVMLCSRSSLSIVSIRGREEESQQMTISGRDECPECGSQQFKKTAIFTLAGRIINVRTVVANPS
jgi:hypothetical protein